MKWIHLHNPERSGTRVTRPGWVLYVLDRESSTDAFGPLLVDSAGG